ncbi:DUF2306 domain-containing protein [Actinophytocola xinjiangensis]|uniref:DUF2306 domain-containing protein n=1 Tax=Actinophytocola xinjiangensis TaxID=485602 RepID=UPI000A9AB03A|nr:DUF2306 domain-containing protein [Actinophytocola xinjiangensis]
MSNTLDHRQTPVTAPRPQRRPKRPKGLIALVVLVVAFLAASLPPYVTLDPSTSIIPINAQIALHYPILLGHILFGTITLFTVCLQLWPRIRRNRPKIHRISGRTYVFAGMIPTCVLALVVVPMGELNLIGASGATVWASLGLFFTIRGYLAGRARDTREHRRWMIYSFATAMGLATGRVIAVGVPAIPGVPDSPDVFFPLGGFWLGWMVNLAIAYWWLNIKPARARAKAKASRVPA